jgi:hypothetical protein
MLCAVGIASPVVAQRTQPADSSARNSRHVAIRVGKWVSLGAATGAAAYGLVANREADRRYTDLERLCEAAPERCGSRSANGAFTDAALEREYQDIARLDNRAKYSLLGAQAAVITGVVLFILDLPRGHGGEDIPYKPPRLQVGYDEQARLELRFRINR